MKFSHSDLDRLETQARRQISNDETYESVVIALVTQCREQLDEIKVLDDKLADLEEKLPTLRDVTKQ